MNLEVIARLAPIILLLIGASFLFYHKKVNPISLGIIGLLILECIAYIEGENNKWINYFSGPLYFVVIHTLYKTISYHFLNKKLYHKILILILITLVIGLLIIHQKHNNFVFHYVAIVELIILIYPIIYFLKLMQQRINFNIKHFTLNSIILLFFSLDIILYVMIKFLLDYDLNSFILISYFRYILIQLFYISLIYFGWKLDKK
ncbi:hypothetical protein GCM10011344_05590 [Dokdonia pacifica]|uniref:Uncharacterized protein n=2 Tax=Dokdonia pacifica TaxID=1627892 RepID=A0A238ZR02_9FLAO|nr:hypothetical protein GCM10011344_05590 [Dokdonia pacifica]SNR85481.1 hypothetical protein SAMN06265376_103426 [Dokdonia pacifica]